MCVQTLYINEWKSLKTYGKEFYLLFGKKKKEWEEEEFCFVLYTIIHFFLQIYACIFNHLRDNFFYRSLLLNNASYYKNLLPASHTETINL